MPIYYEGRQGRSQKLFLGGAAGDFEGANGNLGGGGQLPLCPPPLGMGLKGGVCRISHYGEQPQWDARVVFINIQNIFFSYRIFRLLCTERSVGALAARLLKLMQTLMFGFKNMLLQHQCD